MTTISFALTLLIRSQGDEAEFGGPPNVKKNSFPPTRSTQNAVDRKVGVRPKVRRGLDDDIREHLCGSLKRLQKFFVNYA